MIYGRGLKHIAVQTLRPQSLAKLSSDPMGFFRPHWTGKGWLLEERVPDQAWPEAAN